ncbi:MAG: YggS family pyridoxal phosphate-dependent enzyme [Myxococcales bacterium]|nr:YggS family pyridoxal phosphate-dependent enzyme [Myxococcales bacterium]
MADAALRVGRKPEEITLLGVAKRKRPELIVAAVRAGLRDLAENYVQEAAAKIPAVNAELKNAGLAAPRWHFVGQLQRNKAREVVRLFDVITSVDREPLGTELERRAAQEDRRLDALLQVNLSAESQKGGVDPGALPKLLEASTRWPHLRIVGLMSVPAATEDPEDSRPAFARLRALRDELRGEPGGKHLSELSMGMTGDFEIAIEEGATIVRVGTAIFSPRSES